MSYPRNAASPPRIAIGPVVQISDGAVQTSGVSIKVKPEGGAASAGGGTTSYEEGIVGYVPTQAETDYTAFQLIAYKTGCIPAAVTVVTSASATAGKVVLSGETHTSAVVPTVTTLTNAPSDSSGTTTLLSRLSSSRAGYLDNINNENLSSVPGFPINFASLGINSSGHVGTVTTLTNAPSDSSGITTLLTRIVGTLATGTHQPQTGDGYALAANGTYGLAALKALIDAIDDYIDTEVAAIKAKTDNLPATPASTSDIPSAATNASAVRTELATELGRIDAATSTRLATASYVAPLDAAGTRTAVGLAAATLDTQLATLDALLDAILEDTGTAGVVLSAAMMNKIADHVRRRQQANVEASSDGDALSLLSLYGFIQQAQESNTTDTPGVLTIKKTDGSTTLGTRTLASDPGADPITGVS